MCESGSSEIKKTGSKKRKKVNTNAVSGPGISTFPQIIPGSEYRIR